MSKRDDIKDKILEAASKRFNHYGFNKTTMSEIAGDLDMSAANLYRYFENKNEIVADIAAGYFSRLLEELQKIASDKKLSPETKLENITLRELSFNMNEFENASHASELVDFVCMEKHDKIMAHVEAANKIVEEILSEGVKKGQFHIKDVTSIVNAFRHATLIFHAAPFFLLLMKTKHCCKDEIEKTALSIVRTFVSGISKKNSKP